MTERENYIRAARFDYPERIPISLSISGACWNHYPQEELQELMADHPILFPDFEYQSEPVVPMFAPWRKAGVPHVDSWGCVWKTADDGMTGTVVKRSLPDWEVFSSFIPPSPEHHDGWREIDWNDIRDSIEDARVNGKLTSGSLRHGHTFLTLTYIRGYENLIFDMVDERRELYRVIEMVEELNLGLVRRYVEAEVERMGYPEDLGMQQGPMVSPAHFRKYILPSYRTLVAPAKEAGCIIHMHSDGDIRALAGDLIDAGIEVMNIQDLVNGIDWMEENLKGQVCIDLDIDRQHITRFGTPEEIHSHIRDAVHRLGSREGGLMLKHGLFPGIPIENVRALMDAMERYSTGDAVV